MKKHILLLMLWLLSSLAMQVSAQLINVNPDPNGDPWWAGGLPEITPEIHAELDAIPILSVSTESLLKSLPVVVDNSQNIWFRPIFNQDGESCAQASGIGYLFTYEVNRVRNLPANQAWHTSNQYPTHYTWNYLNNGVGNGSWYYQGWDIIKSSGIPTIEEYGGLWKSISPAIGGRTIWETGYEKYKSYMDNKIIDGYHTINVSTPQGLETLKHWISDHGEGAETGGLANFACYMYGANYEILPPQSAEPGKKIVTNWGNSGYHAMTIVGYNDNIKFDFNGDGQFTNPAGNMAEWEIGALKVANSWGTSYPGSGPVDPDGFVYMPYRLLANVAGSISPRNVHVLKVKEEYTPKVTVRVKISHPARKRLVIRSVVESPGTNIPERSLVYDAYLYRKGGDLPMQGISNEPIEIELDVTSLLDSIIPGKFSIDLIEYSTGNPYNGELLEFKLVDYDTHNGVPIEINYSDASLPQPINTGANRFSILYDYLPSTINEEIAVNRDVLIRKDIRIENGAILQINSATVSVSGNIQTSINPGGKLIVDGGTLTAAQSTWQGIYVEGDRDLPQTFANQGAVILQNGAIIENAVSAINLHSYDEMWWTNGGIVQATNSTFRNNKRDIAFVAYQNKDSSGAEINNISYLTGCTFTIDDNSLFETPIQNVTLWSVKGVEFTNCDFSDTRTQLIYEGSEANARDGIYAYTASFKALGSDFTNLKYGIYNTTVGASHTFTAGNCEFDCFRGLYNNSAVNPNIYSNQFTVRPGYMFNGDMGSCSDTYGLYVDNSLNFNIHDNILTSSGTQAPYCNSFGIIINNSGSTYKNLYRNIFSGFYNGIQASGNNKGVNKVDGLEIRCNTFTSGHYLDIYVTGKGIRYYQGLQRIPTNNELAGNLFSSNTYFINAGDPIRYYHHNPASYPNILPDYYSSNTITFVQPGGGNGIDYDPITSCPITVPDRSLQMLVTDINDAREQYNETDLLLQSYVDDGNTELMTQQVEMANDYDAWQSNASPGTFLTFKY